MRRMGLVVTGIAFAVTFGAVGWGRAVEVWQGFHTEPAVHLGAIRAQAQARAITPERTGQPENCVSCHNGIEEISPSHAIEQVGCVVCHGGDPLAVDVTQAHANLLGGRNPSDPTVVWETCGQPACHDSGDASAGNHVERVLASLHATYAGSIAAVRYAFGLQPSPCAEFGIHAVESVCEPESGTAISSLAQLAAASKPDTVSGKYEQGCLEDGCHITSTARTEAYYYRSTGCAACHYLYGDHGFYLGNDPTISRNEAGHGLAHRLTTAIPFSQCNHCHNRGIYSLRQMSFLPREDLPPLGAALAPDLPQEARRLIESYQPIGDFTRCEWVLDCADCHTGVETMGDGRIYGSKKEALEVFCYTCHGTPSATPVVRAIQDEEDPALNLARLSGKGTFLQVGDRVVLTARGSPLWSVKQTGEGKFVQVAKVSGQIHRVPLVLESECQQDGSSQRIEYCHQCHLTNR